MSRALRVLVSLSAMSRVSSLAFSSIPKPSCGQMIRAWTASSQACTSARRGRQGSIEQFFGTWLSPVCWTYSASPTMSKTGHMSGRVTNACRSRVGTALVAATLLTARVTSAEERGTLTRLSASSLAAPASGLEGPQTIAPRKRPVIFVLGGPGSGKGTQSQRLAKKYGYIHLSAGELLREERESGSEDGKLINEYINEGRIVPVAISLGLLKRAMDQCPARACFLIDGFPRNSDNMDGWESMMVDTAEVRCVLFLDCPEAVLEERLLSRGKTSGRSDDNVLTARKRFKTYVETTLPVVDIFEKKGLVVRVEGSLGVDEVFENVCEKLRPVLEEELLSVNQALLLAEATGDWATFEELCSSSMTSVGGLASKEDRRGWEELEEVRAGAGEGAEGARRGEWTVR
ncbi:unnamed protein product, partial [Discosporangium mesarthrocarpum]